MFCRAHVNSSETPRHAVSADTRWSGHVTRRCLNHMRATHREFGKVVANERPMEGQSIQVVSCADLQSRLATDDRSEVYIVGGRSSSYQMIFKF